MMTERLRLLLLLFFTVLLAGLLLQDASVLLLAIPIVVYILSGWLQAPPTLDLTMEQSINRTSLVAGDDVQVDVTVHNRGGDLRNLALCASVSPAAALSISGGLRRLPVQAGDTAHLVYRVRPARGVHRWGGLHACAADPFGLFEQRITAPPGGELLILPATIELPAFVLHPATSLRAAGQIAARAAGSGTDFWGVKEYAPGDPLRRLNWRRAARTPERLFTNEFQHEQVADFGLVVDTRMLSGDVPVEAALFEARLSAAASLAERLLKGGNRVSLLLFGRTLVPVFPGAGKLQRERIQTTLARAELGGYLALARRGLFPIRLFPARSQIVVFSSFDERDTEVYAWLRAYGFNVLLISPDPVTRSWCELAATPLNQLARRAARIERVLQLSRLVRMGVEVVDWDSSQPLPTALHLGVPRMTRRRERFR